MSRFTSATAWVLFAACVAPVGAGELRPARTDGYGDPLPSGVLARLGSTRFRCDFEPTVMEISPDSRRLVLASGRGQIRVFDWPSGLVLRDYDPGTIPGDSWPFTDLRSIHFTNHPDRFAAVCRDTIHVLDTATGRYSTPLAGTDGIVECISPDRRCAHCRNDPAQSCAALQVFFGFATE